MMRSIVLVGFLITACRSVSPAPPGTPPLVVEIPSHRVAANLPVVVRWEAECSATSTGLDISTKGHELHVSTSTSSFLVPCNEQGFTATASCEPGPCTIVRGHGGISRTLQIAFGRLGVHRLKLVIDNGSIEKSWTANVEAVIADTLRIGCSFFNGREQRSCASEAPHAGAVFSLTADVFAGGERLTADRPLLTTGGLIPHEPGKWRAGTAGTYIVRAQFDGLTAELPLTVLP